MTRSMAYLRFLATSKRRERARGPASTVNYRGERGHGLIMGCSVTGVRPISGGTPLDLGAKPRETRSRKGPNPLASLLRLLVGTLGGFYYFLVPIYMWLKDRALTAFGRPRT